MRWRAFDAVRSGLCDATLAQDTLPRCTLRIYLRASWTKKKDQGGTSSLRGFAFTLPRCASIYATRHIAICLIAVRRRDTITLQRTFAHLALDVHTHTHGYGRNRTRTSARRTCALAPPTPRCAHTGATILISRRLKPVLKHSFFLVMRCACRNR